jgi:hypothetical protein
MMRDVVLLEIPGLAIQTAEALRRASERTTRKLGKAWNDMVEGMRARDRWVWGYFRFELANELAPILTRRFPQISSLYLWEMNGAEPEAAEAPGDPNLDLVLRVDRTPDGLDDAVAAIGRELSASFAGQVPETPLVLTVHPVTSAMAATGIGVAALLHSVHQPLTLIWQAGIDGVLSRGGVKCRAI